MDFHVPVVAEKVAAELAGPADKKYFHEMKSVYEEWYLVRSVDCVTPKTKPVQRFRGVEERVAPVPLRRDRVSEWASRYRTPGRPIAHRAANRRRKT